MSLESLSIVDQDRFESWQECFSLYAWVQVIVLKSIQLSNHVTYHGVEWGDCLHVQISCWDWAQQVLVLLVMIRAYATAFQHLLKGHFCFKYILYLFFISKKHPL
jgi:hypothetical protein